MGVLTHTARHPKFTALVPIGPIRIWIKMCLLCVFLVFMSTLSLRLNVTFACGRWGLPYGVGMTFHSTEVGAGCCTAYRGDHHLTETTWGCMGRMWLSNRWSVWCDHMWNISLWQVSESWPMAVHRPIIGGILINQNVIGMWYRAIYMRIMVEYSWREHHMRARWWVLASTWYTACICIRHTPALSCLLCYFYCAWSVSDRCGWLCSGKPTIVIIYFEIAPRPRRER